VCPGGPAAPRGAPPGPTAALKLGSDQERLLEIYTSPHTESRLALKLRCSEALVDRAPEARFASFLLTVYRSGEDGQLAPLKSNGLRAALGREASNVFSFNVPLAETAAAGKRYRRERMEVRVTPVVVQEGRLQLDIRIEGELATVSALQPTVSHPIDHRESTTLPSGGTHTVDLDIDAGGPDEGWGTVRYRLALVATF
jgi:hypothetical protein